MIAFCTTCMNRLEHLKGTLHHNLRQIQGKPVQWVIVDYSSSQPVSKYLIDERDKAPERFKNVSAYRVNGMLKWNASHAKNIAHTLTDLTGDAVIVSSLDVDTFLLADYSDYLETIMANRPDRFVAPHDTDVFGSITMHKWHFFHLGGYDEDFVSYGFEDTDLIERARRMQLEHATLPSRYDVRIAHAEKTENGCITDHDKAMQASWDILARNRHAPAYTVNVGRSWGYAKDLVALW